MVQFTTYRTKFYYVHSMYQAGLLHLKDVYNKDSKQFYEYVEIQVILPGNYNYLEYYWLVTSIPKHWL